MKACQLQTREPSPDPCDSVDHSPMQAIDTLHTPDRAPDNAGATSDRQIADPQNLHHEALNPSKPGKHSLPFSMERYLDETPQDGGPTYGLVHTGPGHDSRRSILTKALTAFEFRIKNQGSENA